MRWVVMFFIGVFTGLIACAIDVVIEEVSSQKYRLIKKCILYCKQQNLLKFCNSTVWASFI